MNTTPVAGKAEPWGKTNGGRGQTYLAKEVILAEVTKASHKHYGRGDGRQHRRTGEEDSGGQGVSAGRQEVAQGPPVHHTVPVVLGAELVLGQHLELHVVEPWLPPGQDYLIRGSSIRR